MLYRDRAATREAECQLKKARKREKRREKKKHCVEKVDAWWKQEYEKFSQDWWEQFESEGCKQRPLNCVIPDPELLAKLRHTLTLMVRQRRKKLLIPVIMSSAVIGSLVLLLATVGLASCCWPTVCLKSQYTEMSQLLEVVKRATAASKERVCAHWLLFYDHSVHTTQVSLLMPNCSVFYLVLADQQPVWSPCSQCAAGTEARGN